MAMDANSSRTRKDGVISFVMLAVIKSVGWKPSPNPSSHDSSLTRAGVSAFMIVPDLVTHVTRNRTSRLETRSS